MFVKLLVVAETSSWVIVVVVVLDDTIGVERRVDARRFATLIRGFALYTLPVVEILGVVPI